MKSQEHTCSDKRCSCKSEKMVSEIFLSVFRTHTLRKSRKRRNVSSWEIRIMDGVTHSHRFVSAARLTLAIYTLSLKDHVRQCLDSFFFKKLSRTCLHLEHWNASVSACFSTADSDLRRFSSSTLLSAAFLSSDAISCSI